MRLRNTEREKDRETGRERGLQREREPHRCDSCRQTVGGGEELLPPPTAGGGGLCALWLGPVYTRPSVAGQQCWWFSVIQKNYWCVWWGGGDGEVCGGLGQPHPGEWQLSGGSAPASWPWQRSLSRQRCRGQLPARGPPGVNSNCTLP